MDASSEDGVSEYEVRRLEQIAKNVACLVSLGLAEEADLAEANSDVQQAATKLAAAAASGGKAPAARASGGGGKGGGGMGRASTTSKRRAVRRRYNQRRWQCAEQREQLRSAHARTRTRVEAAAETSASSRARLARLPAANGTPETQTVGGALLV